MPFRYRGPYADPHQQIMMIHDATRTARFAEALRATVNPSSVVLDVGSGSGILALIAARAGARHVYAVERTQMAEMISLLAHDNGVADRITVLRKEAAELDGGDFEEAPNLVVAELLGNTAAGESMHSIFAHVRQLFPSVKFMPDRYRLIVTPVRSHYLEELDQLADIEGVNMSGLAKRARSIPTSDFLTPAELAGDSCICAWNDAASRVPFSYKGTTVARRDFNALAVTWEASLAHDVLLRTELEEGRSHWLPVLFPLPSTQLIDREQEVEFEILTRNSERPATWMWTVSCGAQRQTNDAMRDVRTGTLQELLDTLGLESVP